jgi:hypothetical protein
LKVNSYDFNKDNVKFIVCDQGSNLVRIFKQLVKSDDNYQFENIAYHDEVNNKVKIVLEEVNAIILKDVNTAVSDDER